MQLYPSDHLPLGIIVSLGESTSQPGSIDVPVTPYVLPDDEVTVTDSDSEDNTVLVKE